MRSRVRVCAAWMVECFGVASAVAVLAAGCANASSGPSWLGTGGGGGAPPASGSGGTASNVPNVPAGWLQWAPETGGNGHWYQIVRTRTDWESAQASAASRGAYLVTVTSPAEEQFIIDTFLTGSDALTVFWLGLTDHAVEGTWVWVSGEPLSYTNWKSGEPNSWTGDEDYVALNWNAVRGPIGEWADVPNEGTTGFDGGANDGPYAAIVESDQIPRN